jgi:hypothetical protein
VTVLFFLLGVFLLLPDSFLMLMLPDDDVSVRVVRPDDGCCAKPLIKHVPALSEPARCFWRSVGSDGEADDAGGHTHGDLSLLLFVPFVLLSLNYSMMARMLLSVAL